MTISTTTLKNAAFAIEHDLWTDPDGSHWLVKDGAILRRWEPLEDDGDAFRLVVDLRLDLSVNDGKINVYGGEDWMAETYEEHECGRRAARNAIVRAAASIGAALCQS